MMIIIIIAIITIVIFLIRVQFKLTYIFYTKKNNVGLFVLYKVNIKINKWSRHVTVTQNNCGMSQL